MQNDGMIVDFSDRLRRHPRNWSKNKFESILLYIFSLNTLIKSTLYICIFLIVRITYVYKVRN